MPQSGAALDPRDSAPVLNIWNDLWEFRPQDCPCDVDFVDWLDAACIRDSAIYHFGTGGHHHVGIECAKPHRRNAVLAITAAPREYETFVQLAIARPDVLRHYNAVFGDIYLANGRLLPEFDVVTLFHLCEFRGEANEAYGAMSDLDLMNLMTERLKPGGHLLVFPGSFAWDRADHSAKDVVADWARAQPVERVGTFRSLDIYRKKS